MNWTRGKCLASAILLATCAIFGSTEVATAARCGTGRHGEPQARFEPLSRQVATAVARSVAPVSIGTAHAFLTEHFRVLWGGNFDAGDPEWQDPDGDGVPIWVETLSAALEHAYEVQADLGFPPPYGVETYYLDAYVGNTGVTADPRNTAITTDFYAYTEIDRNYGVAYFVFNDDFSLHVTDELAVLRATAAHELFHAVQRAMDYPWDDNLQIPDSRWNRESWFLEATATWMEEVTEPEVDDYVTYVQDFLARPQLALSSLDGLHEYGAAVFAGYVWQLYGGAELLRTVYENAYALQLEGALRQGIATHGGGDLEDVVAGFWARAANPPVAIWSDANRFAGASLLAVAAALPITVSPDSADRPGRFGANLIEVPAGSLPALAGLAWPDAAAAWRIAAADGSATGAEVLSPTNGGATVVFGPGTGGSAYLAVVNVSAAAGTRSYSAEVGDDGVPAAPASSGGGGGGGCFLRALSP